MKIFIYAEEQKGKKLQWYYIGDFTFKEENSGLVVTRQANFKKYFELYMIKHNNPKTKYIF